jgi:hypothetical protein
MVPAMDGGREGEGDWEADCLVGARRTFSSATTTAKTADRAAAAAEEANHDHHDRGGRRQISRAIRCCQTRERALAEDGGGRDDSQPRRSRTIPNRKERKRRDNKALTKTRPGRRAAPLRGRRRNPTDPCVQRSPSTRTPAQTRSTVRKPFSLFFKLTKPDVGYPLPDDLI